MGTEIQIADPKQALTFLGELKPQLGAAIAGRVREALYCCALTSFQRNPKLLLCTKESVAGSLLMCAQSNLMPDNGLGHAYLVPFKNNKTGRYECQFISGYRGLVDIAYRSGQIGSICAEVVREGDHFDYSLGMNPKLEHKPLANNKGKMLFAYAAAKTRLGEPVIEVMDSDSVLAIKARSKSAAYGGPWQTDEPEMWKKTVLRRMCKKLPASVLPIEIAGILEQEDAREYMHGRQAEVIINAPVTVHNEDPAEGMEPEEDFSSPEDAIPEMPAEQSPMATKGDIVGLQRSIADNAKRLSRDPEDLKAEIKAKVWGDPEKPSNKITLAECEAAKLWLAKQGR